MKSCHSLSSWLVSVMVFLILVSGFFFLISALLAIRESHLSRSEQVRRLQLASLSSRISSHVRSGDFENFSSIVEPARAFADGDPTTLDFIARIRREADSRSPSRQRLVALGSGWKYYERHELERAIQDIGKGSRSRAFEALLVWFLFSALSLYLGRKLFRRSVRPLVFLSRYFERMDLSKDIDPLFRSETERHSSGVEDSPRETQKLFGGAHELLEKLREFRQINISRLLEQTKRAQILAAASQDGVFFLRGSKVTWCNDIGAQLLGLSSSGAKFEVSLDVEAASNPFGVAQAIQSTVERSTPEEWRMSGAHSNEGRAYLLSCFSQFDAQEYRTMDCDRIVIAQDVSWLRQAEEARTHFMGLLSHEVKTPVTSLLMATRLLQRSAASTMNPIQRKLLDASVRDVDRLRELIDELFSASSADHHARCLNLRSADLRRVVAQSVRSVRSEAEARSISMDLLFDGLGSEVTARLDAARISWTISQLVTQTVRHVSRNSKVQIRMSESSQEAVEFFEVRVRGSGTSSGRPLDARVFERGFVQYDLRVGRTSPTGMSLAIAREIVVGHGGSLTLNSEYREGIEFILRLPRTRLAEPLLSAQA